MYVWSLFFVSVTCGLFLIIILKSNQILGMGSIGLNLLTFYLLPYIRTGLTYGRGDVLAQLGHLREIDEAGNFYPDTLMYPFTHLGIYGISILSDIEFQLAASIYLPIIIVVYIVFTFAISRMIFRGSFAIVLVFLVAMFPMYDSYTNQLMPNGIAMYLLMMLLYVLIRGRVSINARWLLIGLVVVPSLVIAHPLVGLLALQAIVITMLIYYFVSRMPVHPGHRVLTSQFGRSYAFIVVLFAIIYSGWYIGLTTRWHGFINSIILFVQGIDQPVTGTAEVGRRTAVLSQSELIELFVIKYGGQVAVSILTMVGIYIIIRSYLRHGSFRWRIYLITPLVIWLVLNSLYLFGGIIAPEVFFPPLRFASMVYLTTPIFAGLALLKIIQSKNGGIIGLVLLISMFGIFGIGFYDGSHTTGATGQQTHAEIEGTKWVIENKDEEIAVLGFGGYRYEQSLLGRDTVMNERRSEFPRSHDEHGTLPVNLTTQNDRFILDELNSDRYIQISEADHTRGIQTRVSENHEHRLSSQANRLYSNGEYRIYFNSQRAIQ